jgi:ABC-type transporter MlaC component
MQARYTVPKRRLLRQFRSQPQPMPPMKNYAALIPVAALVALAPAQAQNQPAPDAQVRAAVENVLGIMQSDAAARSGDMARITAIVQRHFLPYTDFEYTTRLAVGKAWKEATPEQRQKLFLQFQAMLANTYALSLSQLREQNVKFQYAPSRQGGSVSDAVVQTHVVANGEDMQIDYRLSRTQNGWKIYDINMMGAWLIEIYRRQFAEILARDGVEGLLKYLERHNKAGG